MKNNAESLKDKLKRLNKIDLGEKSELITFIISVILLLVSFIPILSVFSKDLLRMIAAVLAAYPMLISAIKGIKEKEFEESLLMVIAVVAAMFLGKYFEAAAVAVLFRFGEILEEYAEERSKKSIESLYSIVSDTGHIVRESGGFEIIDSDDIEIGMKLAVLPHEIIPVDGVIYDGKGSVDTSSLTGENLPVNVGEGDMIYSGTVNGSTTLLYEATAVKSDSRAQRIISLVEEAAEKKSKTQKLIDKFVKFYTPAVIAVAVLLAIIPSIITKAPSVWIYRALVVLMSSCPCSIVLSVPLAYLSSMGACAKNGLIIKGSNFIETLAQSEVVAFDKTGTLTNDKPVIGEIYTSEGYSNDEILSLAQRCEHYSTHPIAKAISDFNSYNSDFEIDDFEEISGAGVKAKLAEGDVMCVSGKYAADNGIDIAGLPQSTIYVILNGITVGTIEIVTQVRTQALQCVKSLRSLGVKKIIMLTGDEKSKAERVSNELSLDECKAGLLPEEKMTALEEIKSGNNKFIYVGDGINDAPALALADVGVAMGLGAKSAAEAADMILTDSNLLHLPDAVLQSKRTVSTMKANIIFSLVVKLAVIILGIIGIAPIWLAVAADVGTMIICVLNAARLLKMKHSLQA